jgi:hypothetical protein
MVCTGLLSHPTLFYPVIDKKLSVRMQPLFTVPVPPLPAVRTFSSSSVTFDGSDPERPPPAGKERRQCAGRVIIDRNR